MILKTPRLFLDAPDMSDAELFSSWLNDIHIVRYSEQRHKWHTAETQRDYWRSSATAEPNFVYTIYQDHEVGNPIGSIAYRIDTANNVANAGIMIGDKAAQGKGYGFEAWEIVCNYLFIEKKVRKIEAGCMTVNAAMNSICMKYNMTREATITGHFLLNGEPVSMNLYGSFSA